MALRSKLARICPTIAVRCSPVAVASCRFSGSISALAVTNERSCASVYVPGVAGVVACALCVVVLCVVVVDVDGALEVEGAEVVVVVVRSVVEAVRVAPDDDALVLSSCTQPAVSASAAAAASHDNLDIRCSSVSSAPSQGELRAYLMHVPGNHQGTAGLSKFPRRAEQSIEQRVQLFALVIVQCGKQLLLTRQRNRRDACVHAFTL